MKTKGLDLLRPPRGQPVRGRRQMRTRRRWTWRTLLRAPIPQLVALAVVLGGLYALASSSVFNIKTVEAVGAPELQGLVQENCACLDRNIFFERPDTIRARIGASLPWVDVRKVYARLPNRIVVDIAYRQPAVLWRTAVTTYTVADDGTVLYEVKKPPLPQIVAPTTATVPLVYSPRDTTFPQPPLTAKVDPIAVRMVLATKRGLAPALAPTVDRFHWSATSGLAAHSTLGWWAFLGIFLGDDLRQRLVDLEAANAQGFRRLAPTCNYLDLQVLPYGHCSHEKQWEKPLGP